MTRKRKNIDSDNDNTKLYSYKNQIILPKNVFIIHALSLLWQAQYLHYFASKTIIIKDPLSMLTLRRPVLCLSFSFFSIIIQCINTLNNVVFMTCPSNLYENIFLLQSKKAILINLTLQTEMLKIVKHSYRQMWIILKIIPSCVHRMVFKTI